MVKRIFAYMSRCRAYRLPKSQENKAVKAVCAAVDKCQALEEEGLARSIVDWVIMYVPCFISPLSKNDVR